MKIFWSVLLCLGLSHIAMADLTRYVAPTARGNGSGTSPANAASYTNGSFWNGVQSSLANSAVTVRWLDGQYSSAGLTLTDMGHQYHKLTLTGDSNTGAVLNAPVDYMLFLRGVQNMTIKNLHFTGPITEFGVHITSSSSGPSRKVLLDSLSFTDLTQLGFGATAVRRGSYDVSLRNSTFDNVGIDAHAHMMYNAFDAHHITVYENTFIDSRGDYVRFRDNTDFTTVINNTFIANSSPYTTAFVAMPLFIDVSPGDENFGTHYRVAGNSFTYNSTSGKVSDRYAIRFHHRGYDPPGFNHLMTAAEGEILESGTPAQKKALLLANTGIDGDKVHVYDNTYTNAALQGAFGSHTSYGSVSKGWEGWGDVYDTWNHTVPSSSPGSSRVSWTFDGGDNGGSGWVNNSYQSLLDAGWRFSQNDNAKTFVDTSGTFGEDSGLLWLRDWQQADTIWADYQFDYLPEGRFEWRMGAAGSGNQLRLYNGRPEEGGLMVLGVHMVDSDTVRILGEPTATRDRDFPGTDFGEIRTWRWDWISDPDGVNGIANLSFQRDDDVWETVYERPFDANVVPDTLWLQSVGDLAQNRYLVFDSFAVSVLPPLNVVAGDLNQDGMLDELDINLFVAGWHSDTSLMLPSTKYYHGDLNLDGTTDLEDAFQLHLALVSNGAGGLDFSRLRNVPEPTHFVLIVCVTAYLICNFRKEQHPFRTNPADGRCSNVETQ